MFSKISVSHKKTVTFRKINNESKRHELKKETNCRSKTVLPASSLKHKRDISIGKSTFASYNTKSSTLENSNSRSNSINEIHRQSHKKENYIQTLYDKYDNLNKKLNNQNTNTKLIKKNEQYLTPIPQICKTLNNNLQQSLRDKAISNAVVLRRLEYNKHLRGIKTKSKKNIIQKKKTIKKPKIIKKNYDISKVIEIQKVCKGYLTRKINYKIYRMKTRRCLVETFCLLLKRYFYEARKQKAFKKLKMLYHVPFKNIGSEMSFEDKLRILLANNYYNMFENGNYRLSEKK